MHIEQFTFNALQTRCSVVWDEDGFCAFIDPGCASGKEISSITEFVASHGLKPVCIMLTHAHFDHIYGMAALAREYGIDVYMHDEEMFTIENTNPTVCRAYGLPLPETFPVVMTEEESALQSRHVSIRENDIIRVGSLEFKVLETPGHSAGGVCFYEHRHRILFSGDTLFAGAIGRSDHPGGDYDMLMKSILEKVVTLNGEVRVIPGHGPCTDIATEGMTNPFLLPFNEPYED